VSDSSEYAGSASLQNNPKQRSAFVAFVGRPNAGKSTLLNALLGEQLALVSQLPQTTRKVMKGILTKENLQLVFVDTPGIHHTGHTFNKAMSRSSEQVLTQKDADIICYCVDLSRSFGDEEDIVANLVSSARIPAIVIFTKADLVDQKVFCKSTRIIIRGFIKRYPQLAKTPRMIIAAHQPKAAARFLRVLDPFVKSGPQFFPDDDITDADLRFFASECVRKRIIELTREEVPHATFVEIEQYKEKNGRHEVDATIHVETDGQKAIIIGAKGAMIREIQKLANEDFEKIAQGKVSIRCHIKVSPKWRDDKAFLQRQGMKV
jgi:GTP-binding protein Era